MERILARTKRYVSEEEELRRWREGLGTALRAKRAGRRFVKGLALSLLVVVAVAAGGAAYLLRDIESLFAREQLDLNPVQQGALNVLLIGSDSREGIDDPEDVRRFGRVGGRRADTIILAQVVPSEQRGVLLHFPRDLWVPIPAGPGRRAHYSKINSAYNFGAQAVIDTIQGVTGIPINHYMEIDIQGFRRMVDAMGGIDVCLEDRFYDSKLRFRLPAGPNHLDGEAALSYVRARHATSDGDFGRIRRQQQFLKAVVSKVGRPSVIGNPIRVNELARAFASNVTVDQFFNLDDIVKFALSVKRVGPDQLETLTVPGDLGKAAGQSVVQIDETEADSVFAAIREARPVVSDPVLPGEPGPDGPPVTAPEPADPVPAGPCAGLEV